ncbi:ATP-dependent RNA helicase, partial [bacterium]|nr:ATP-dependent RNA helicase [bacterium]
MPIDPLLPEIVEKVRAGGALVLEAEPGAGKTTRVPPALLEIFPGEVLVLEPRRIAARLAAQRVARERGEKPGETVGYQTRFEERSGPRTRLRFLTEGILVRRLLRDPLQDGVSLVVLDEFHERHLEGDLALALLAHARRKRGDLAIVVMSATLDVGPVAAFLGAPVLSAPGAAFEVAIEHESGSAPLPERVRSALERVVSERTPDPPGDVLVFLPGASEIRAALGACSSLARERALSLLPLHGRLSSSEQDRALEPSSQRKAIFSTNVAETSVTIEGVACVIDSGLARVAGCSSWSGLPTLEVEPISRASAKQRAGRAGRTRPGKCVRLYSKEDHDARPAFAAPEIARVDLAETVLALRAAGHDARTLPWLEAPPSFPIETAEGLLAKLGAISQGGVTAIGRRLLSLPLHPRLARVVVEAEERGVAREGVAIAALLNERSIGAFTLERGRSSSGKRDEGEAASDALELLERFEAARRADFQESALAALGVDPFA